MEWRKEPASLWCRAWRWIGTLCGWRERPAALANTKSGIWQRAPRQRLGRRRLARGPAAKKRRRCTWKWRTGQKGFEPRIRKRTQTRNGTEWTQSSCRKSSARTCLFCSRTSDRVRAVVAPGNEIVRLRNRSPKRLVVPPVHLCPHQYEQLEIKIKLIIQILCMKPVIHWTKRFDTHTHNLGENRFKTKYVYFLENIYKSTSRDLRKRRTVKPRYIDLGGIHFLSSHNFWTTWHRTKIKSFNGFNYQNLEY